MYDKRVALSPGMVIVSGAIAVALWILGLGMMLDLRQDVLIIAAASAIFGVLGSAVGAIWQTWSRRHSHDSLVRAEHEASHDPLTGLYNRAALFVELEQALERARKNDTVTGVLFLDIDRFKAINDGFGHDTGDELLRIVAARLKRAIRGTDIVARFGGDEFVVVCRDLMSARSVLSVGDQILNHFKEPFSLNGMSKKISTSIGIAIAQPTDTRSSEELVRDADVAMYKAKKERLGKAVFDQQQRDAVDQRRDLERDLQQAIDEQQFLVVYQPLINVPAGKLYGFEALVRWQHPDLGLLGPGQFIPVVEEAGMMDQLGRFVLREACAQAAEWNHLTSHARDIKMSVNVAEQQLIKSDMPELVAETLAWSGLPPDQLVLEILEDVIVDHLNGLSMLRQIKAMGVNLAIDDFGTGQSSLSYVKDFDMVTTLKIDKTFVDSMEEGSSNRAIIDAIVAMARALKMNVVAEGVETERQVQQLLGFGIDIMQGYLFHRPVEASQIDPRHWFATRMEPTPKEEARPIEPSSRPAKLAAPKVERLRRPARRS